MCAHVCARARILSQILCAHVPRALWRACDCHGVAAAAPGPALLVKYGIRCLSLSPLLFLSLPLSPPSPPSPPLSVALCLAPPPEKREAPLAHALNLALANFREEGEEFILVDATALIDVSRHKSGMQVSADAGCGMAVRKVQICFYHNCQKIFDVQLFHWVY